MKKSVMAAIGMALLISSVAANAGPFGLEMGQSLTQIDNDAKQAAPNVYTTSEVPKPHSAFELYALKIGKKNGLCWVKAIGKDIGTSAYGIELKSEFNDMKSKLEKAYGKHETTDVLLPGSIWDEPDDFMMAMIKKERFLMAVWDREQGSSLKDNLESIALIASPGGRDEGYLSLEYSFSNKEVCDKEIAALEDGAL